MSSPWSPTEATSAFLAVLNSHALPTAEVAVTETPQSAREVQFIREFIDTAEELVSKLVPCIGVYKNYISPIRRLPSELLAEIFSLSRSEEDARTAKFGSFDNGPWAVTVVCRQWRGVALSTTSLWSEMSLRLGSERDDYMFSWQKREETKFRTSTHTPLVVMLVSEGLRRAGSSQMSLNFMYETESTKPEIDIKIMAAIFQDPSRWSSIKLKISFESKRRDPDPLDVALPDSFPSLHHADIELLGCRISLLPFVNSSQIETLRLRTQSLEERITVPVPTKALLSLKSIDLSFLGQSMPMEDVVQLLRQTPNIESIKFYDASWSGVPKAEPIDLASLTSLVSPVPRLLEHIISPSLKTLTVGRNSDSNEEEAEDEEWEDWDQNLASLRRMKSLFQRSLCQLTSLTMHQTVFCPRLEAIFKDMTSLECLRFELTSISEPVERSFTEFATTLRDDTLLLPNLRELAINWTSENDCAGDGGYVSMDFLDDQFVEMVGRRFHAKEGETSLAVVLIESNALDLKLGRLTDELRSDLYDWGQEGLVYDLPTEMSDSDENNSEEEDNSDEEGGEEEETNSDD